MNLFKHLSLIFEAYLELVLDSIKGEINNEKLDICNKCKKRFWFLCGKCFCVIQAKTRCNKCKCPIKKW